MGIGPAVHIHQVQLVDRLVDMLAVVASEALEASGA